MTQKFPPLVPRCPHLLHGADYNPEQWPEEVWTEDMRLMKKARCNVMSVGIFSWSKLEPEEGRFTFEWLDRVLDLLAENGIVAVLATPSGGRPAWMSARYPEVLSVKRDRTRLLHGARHNHCLSSPVYREKTRGINTRLAERYKAHPALAIWHVGNEFSGVGDQGSECHCDLCQEAFRRWLQARYGTLDALNAAWWNTFWSHTYSEWSQVVSPSPRGEFSVHGLNLDWHRFITAQTIDFFANEAAPLRAITPEVPITTNFMGTHPGLDYAAFAPHLDIISWDSYPLWHEPGIDPLLGAATAFAHDLNRSLKGGKPFMLMESTPSVVNWARVNKLKRPGMHRLSSLQAVAHGADTVQYFQWRKSRGGFEKFHGAVVDHAGHEGTRVFADVAEVGADLAALDALVGTSVQAEVAVVYDWENRWAIQDAKAIRHECKDYAKTCEAHHRAFWKLAVPVDVIASVADFSGYKLLVAPMLYLTRPGVAERIERFVREGGCFVATYWSGLVDENDLCHLGGFPGPLREILGSWAEETDTLYDEDVNAVAFAADNALGLEGTYTLREICDLIHAERATVLATYTADFYAGRPALTVNAYGQGRAYYVASRNEERFHDDFYGRLVSDLGIRQTLPGRLPPGVTAQRRTDGQRTFVFLLNFTTASHGIALPTGTFRDLLAGSEVSGELTLEPYGVRVLETAAAPSPK